MRIAGGTTAGGPRRGPGPAGVLLGVLVLITGVIVGYAGQSVVSIGAPARVSVSAAVLGSSGGVGRTRPARVRLSIGVANAGQARVRVIGGWSDTVTTSIRGLSPATLEVPAGSLRVFALDVAVQCNWPSELTLPQLRMEEPNGEERPLTLTGAYALSDACSRGTPEARPLAVASVKTIGPVDDDRPGPACSIPAKDGSRACDRLSVALKTPSGRPVDIMGVRAGGVELALSQTLPDGTSPSDGNDTEVAHVFGGGGESVIELTAPPDCPPEWLTPGIPSSIQLDLANGYTPTLALGLTMSAWILNSACRPDRDQP